MVEQIVNRLGENFDAVEILVSRATVEGTERFFLGNGNWYARTGMAHAFIESDAAEVASDKIAEKLKSD